MKTDRLSTEEIRDMFEEAFQSQVGNEAGFDTFDIECLRATDGKVTVNATIYGMAGTPTVDDFKSGKIEGADVVEIERYDVGKMTFKIDLKQTCNLNGTDYLLVYQSI